MLILNFTVQYILMVVFTYGAIVFSKFNRNQKIGMLIGYTVLLVITVVLNALSPETN